MDSLNNDNILLCFPPCVRATIQELWIDGKVGVSGMNIVLAPFLNKRTVENYGTPFCNHFLLRIPYASKQLEWEIIFNEEDYTFAPDFYFRDEHFLSDPDYDVIMNNVPSLVQWNLKNPKSLITVLRELVTFYKKIQIERLQNEDMFGKLCEEYSFFGNAYISEDCVEVNIDNNQAVTFLISIAIDYSCLPSYIQPVFLENGISSHKLLNCSNDTALLKIHFQKPEGGRVTVQLLLSARLEQVIGNSQVHIPPYTKDNKLVDYVSVVSKLLQDRIKEIEKHHTLKNEYISTLVGLHLFNVVEFDSVKFSKATLLCEVDEFFCLVFITIGNSFPAEKPVIILRSIYNLNYGKPYLKQLNSYPYSPRWKPEEMITRLFKELLQDIPKFKNDSLHIVQKE